jgi:hypothetical protein
MGVGTAAAATTGSTNTNNSNNNNNKHYAWDDFVRQGTRLKTFLDDAMQHVKTNTTKLVSIGSKRPRANDSNDNDEVHENSNNDSDGEDDDSPRPLRRRRVEENDYTAELAREKTEQVMLLQRVSASECGSECIKLSWYRMHRIVVY